MDFRKIILITSILSFKLLENNIKCLHFQTNETLNAEIEAMTREIVFKYFKNFHCIAVITEDRHFNVISAGIPMFHILKSPLFNFKDLVLKTFDGGCSGYIIQVSNPLLMIRLIGKISRRSAQRRDRKYLFLPVTKNKRITFVNNIRNIFKIREIQFVPDFVFARITNVTLKPDEMGERLFRVPETTKNTVFINYNKSINERNIKCVPHCKGSQKNESADSISILQIATNEMKKSNFRIELVTHKFIGPEPSTEVLLDVWDPANGFLLCNDLFPNKISNMWGKEIIIATFEYPPYIVFDFYGERQSYDGVEFQIATETAKIHNFSWKVMFVDEDQWGKVWCNGSGTGLSGIISEDKADIGLGAMFLWYSKYQFFDYTHPYSRSAVTCLLPKPKMLPGWMTPTLPFNLDMWITIGATLLLSATALYIFRKLSYICLDRGYNHRGLCWILMQTWGMLLQQAPKLTKDMNTHTPIRHLISWLFVLFILISALYCGGLASVLTVPRFEASVDTPEQLARSGILWAGPHEVWIDSIKDSDDPILQEVSRNFRVLSWNVLEERSREADIGFGIERLTGRDYGIHDYLDESYLSKYHVMKHKLYWGYNAIVTRKSSPYRDIMNNVINKLVESGIVLFWEGLVIRKYMSQNAQLAIKNNEDAMCMSCNAKQEPKILTLAHVQGPFILLVLGLILAAVTFFLEIYLH